MSENRPREFWILNKQGIVFEGFPVFQHEVKGLGTEQIHVREVIEADTSCESKTDAAAQKITEKNAEIAKLRDALKVARRVVEQARMLSLDPEDYEYLRPLSDFTTEFDSLLAAASIAHERIRSILGEPTPKEGDITPGGGGE